MTLGRPGAGTLVGKPGERIVVGRALACAGLQSRWFAWRTKVRRRLKPAPHNTALFEAVAVPFLLALLPAISYAQSPSDSPEPEIATDRPAITDSSIVVPKESLQLENGLTWTSDHGRQTIDLSETLMRFGLSTRTEIRIVVPNYFVGLSHSSSGFGDLALGVKQQIGPLSGGFDLSVVAAISLPTGADRISSHGFDPFLQFPWSKDLRAGWSIGGMQSVFWYTENTRRNLTWEPTLYIQKEIMKRWDVFGEYAGDFPQWDGSRQIAHFGTVYGITPKQQVDFHFGFGLSHAAPGHFLAVGYSFRVDKLSGH
ncbi:MAG TPA: transporter [Bryobacteraceae bacterium]|nr:transporter [Bryobacteraceae bacterium]